MDQKEMLFQTEAEISPDLDLAPPKIWRRLIPGWLRALIWLDSSIHYDAFLSYSWQADSKTAPVIHSILQRFRCPWYKLRAKTIFRDLSCLPAGSSLEKELLDRIERSTHLILLASPEAANSRGMEMEADHWFRKKRHGEVLIIVTKGEFATWNEIRERLLPPTVREKFTSEAIWVPLQHRRSEIVDDPNNPALHGQLIEDLRQIFLCLYAPSTWGELQGQERVQRRRALSMISAVAVLLIGLSILAINFGFGERRNTREATARELAAYSTESLNEDPERSVLLGMQAVNATVQYGQPSVSVAESALHQALLASQVRLTLRGHSEPVTGVAISPDGKRFATASGDKTAKIWDAVNGREILTLRGHSDKVLSVAFSPDGKRLATASGDKTAKIWDAVNGRELLTLRGHSDKVLSVAFSPDGKRLATAGRDETARFWDSVGGQELLTVRHTHSRSIFPNAVYQVTFSPDGRRVATSSNDGTAKVWDAISGNELLNLRAGRTFPITSNVHGRIVRDSNGQEHRVIPVSNPPDRATAVAFSPDGKRLVTCSRTAKVWDAVSGQELLALEGHSDWVVSVAFSPDGKRLATSSDDKTAKVWDAVGGQELMTLRGHSGKVLGIAFTPDGKHLVTSSDDKTAKVWDAVSQELLTLQGHLKTIYKVVFSPDGKYLATASEDGTAKVWDAFSGQERLSLPKEADSNYESVFSDVAFSADGKHLATASSTDGNAKVWDAVSGHELMNLRSDSTSEFSNCCLTVALSPDGRHLATSKITATVWDIFSGQVLLTLRGHSGDFYSGAISRVGFSRNGKYLATSSSDKTAKIWDAVNGKELLTLRGHSEGLTDVDFSPDGKRLATSSCDKTVKVWDAVSGKELLTLRGHSGCVSSVAFSPDGKRLVTSSGDQTAKVWDAISGKELLTLRGQSGPFSSVAFSPDGKRLAVSGNDKTVQIYAVEIRELLNLARSRVTRNLTDEECQRYLQSATCPPLP